MSRPGYTVGAHSGPARAGAICFGDQSCATAVGEEAERPADEDEDAILEADEVPEVDDEPGDPGDEAAQLQALEVGDRRCAADRGQVALVAVAERFRLPRAQPRPHHLPRVPALLHGDRR